jgi:hypothetical protein
MRVLPFIVRAVCGALTLVAATGAIAQQPSIVGTWEWTRKANNCVERYVFRGDGTLSIRSGDENTESTYRIAWSPEPNGRYKLSLATVKDSGGAGCADTAESRTGRQDIVYVLFGGSRTTMILCKSVDGADCIGPLKRNTP